MAEKHNEATEHRPLGDRPIDAPQVTINLKSLIEQIKNEQAWQESDRNAITVFKSNGMRIVLIALHKGAVMAEHKANGLISVQVIEGKMIFKTAVQSVELSSGQMVALHEGIAHSVTASEETVFLLTLTTGS